MDDEERFIAVDHKKLTPEALRGLLEEFITREGTDYGHQEVSIDDKVRDVERQLGSGEAKIVFDTVEDRANIVPTKS